MRKASVISEGLESGLTTGDAPFIEEARSRGELYIHQPYELYSAENHESWRRLWERIQPRWERYANGHFLAGIDTLHPPPDRIPRLDDINRILRPMTGFQAKPVSGYVPAFLFFDCLRRREFPTTITIRPGSQLDYLPEPDIFHDLAGHVPMHTEKAFADTLVRFGDCAHTAVEITSSIRDEKKRARRLTSIIRAMSRFFWFTIEFGLMRAPRGICAYGSGLLSSYGEFAACDYVGRSGPLPDPDRMGDQPGLRNRPLSAAAVRGRFVWAFIRYGGPVGTLDARRETRQCVAGCASHRRGGFAEFSGSCEFLKVGTLPAGKPAVGRKA